MARPEDAPAHYAVLSGVLERARPPQARRRSRRLRGRLGPAAGAGWARPRPRAGGSAAGARRPSAVWPDLVGRRPENGRHPGLLWPPPEGARPRRTRPRRCWTGRSRRTARRSTSSPTAPRPTSTSASSCANSGEAARGHRRRPQGHQAQARPCRGPQQPGLGQALRSRFHDYPAAEAANTASDPAQARLRPGPLEPRQRPERQGKVAEAIAEYREAIRLKPDDAEAHTTSASPCGAPGEARRGDRRNPRSDPPQARLRRGPLQPRPSP